MPLNAQQLRAITWVEFYWNRFGEFPERSNIPAEHRPSVDLSNELVVKALRNRGISVGRVEFEPTTEQMAAITAMVNYDDKRSKSTKLGDLGISLAKWNGWMKDPQFKEYLHELSTNNFGDALHTAHEGLLKAVEDGKVDAVKYYMELTGRAKETDPQLQNIRTIMARIIESLQYRVRDPQIISRVANDFEEIINGRVPQYMAVEQSRIGDTI